MKDIVIIGAGPAGLTAAIYALRAGAKVTVCESEIYGGQASIIDKIENYPGFASITGMEFSSSIYDQVRKLGGEFNFSRVIEVDLNSDIKSLKLSNGELLEAKSVIVANGLKRRILGCTGEKEFIGKGVSYCATCDGAFFKSKKVVVVGGGNTALEDALYLSNICKEVTLVVRKDKFRGEAYLVNDMNERSNIKVLFNTNVKEISGEEAVNRVSFINSEGKCWDQEIDGVFIAIGYQPDCEIYKGQINMNEKGYFLADETCETNIAGVYVAGDCRIKALRQIVTAVADGAVAGNKAAEYVRRKI